MFKLVVIGTSLGGLSALKVLLSGLPADFPVPIAIVQHRHKDSNDLMTLFLQNHALLPLKEVEDKDDIRPSFVYVAPPDYHLLIDKDSFSLSTDPPVSYARPSIDVLFESAADAYAQQVIGIILTGANQDGAKGLARIKARGGLTIVQEPKTAESPIMPEAALSALERFTPKLAVCNAPLSESESAATGVDWILPLSEIASRLITLCQSARK